MKNLHHQIQRMQFMAILALLLMSSAGSTVQAVDTLRLRIDDAVKMAIESSPLMISARYDSLTTQNQWRYTRGLRLPQLRFSQDAPAWRESLNEEFFYSNELEEFIYKRVPSGELKWQSRINVAQATPWGATIDLSSRVYKRKWFWTGSDSIGIETRREFEEYSMLNRILIDQPLLAGNPVRRDFQMGKIDFSRGQIEFMLQKREVIYNLKTVYYGQVSAEEALKISAQALKRGREAEELAERKFNAGLIPEVDWMRIQVELARREGEFSQAEARAESAKERLRLLLGLSLDQPIEVRFYDMLNEADYQPPLESSGKRLEIEADELSIQRLELQTKASVWDKRIRASLQLYYEMDTRQDKFADLGETGDQNRGVSLHFEIPLYGFGTTVSEIENLKLAQKRSLNNLKIRKNNLAADTRQAMRDLELARRRISIVSASVELTQKSLNISEDRFKNGLINSRELIDAQIDLTRVNQEWLNARIDYELALAYLERIAPAGNINR